MESHDLTNLLLIALITIVAVAASIQFIDQQVPCSGLANVAGKFQTVSGWTTRLNDRYCEVTIAGTSELLNTTWLGQ